jgi:Domain of unknown function (DUF4249)
MRTRTSPYRLSRTNRWPLLLLCCLLCQCVQTYVSPYKSPPTGYIVVEGYISNNSPTTYRLSRTIELPGDSVIPAVSGAQVQVEGSDSSVYPLYDHGGGMYGDTTLTLNQALRYRLRINTTDGDRFLSDFVPLKPSPPIDSVNWVYDKSTGNVIIYVNTHDLMDSTRYYQWTYDQTWQYLSPEGSAVIYDTAKNTVIPRLPSQFVSRCWMDVPSTQLLIDNTTKLAQDVVYEYPLVTIPAGTEQLSSLYSINVTQTTLTAQGYAFLTQMQTNTESLGSVFDIQPTELIGNIHCLSDPTKQAIGYISAGTAVQQRIYISYYQLPFWEYIYDCPGPNRLVPDIPDSLRFYFGTGYDPIDETPAGIVANLAPCIDCTLRGGTTVKPPFWPN